MYILYLPVWFAILLKAPTYLCTQAITAIPFQAKILQKSALLNVQRADLLLVHLVVVCRRRHHAQNIFKNDRPGDDGTLRSV